MGCQRKLNTDHQRKARFDAVGILNLPAGDNELTVVPQRSSLHATGIKHGLEVERPMLTGSGEKALAAFPPRAKP